MQKGSSKNPWNKSTLRKRCRARWAKGKKGLGLDMHCANSYITQHIYIYIYIYIQCAEHAGCRNLHSARLALCLSCPLPTYSPAPLSQITLVPWVFGGSFLHSPTSILHPFTIVKWFLYTLMLVIGYGHKFIM